MKRVVQLMVVLLLVISTVAAQQQNPNKKEQLEEWRPLYLNNDEVTFIHSRIVTLENGTKKVILREVAIKEKDKGWMDREGAINFIEYLKFAHKLLVWEFDCVNERGRLRAYSKYNDKGEVISSYTAKDSELKWDDILPGTRINIVFEFVCKK